jgi:hypothetical protein
VIKPASFGRVTSVWALRVRAQCEGAALAVRERPGLPSASAEAGESRENLATTLAPFLITLGQTFDAETSHAVQMIVEWFGWVEEKRQCPVSA